VLEKLAQGDRAFAAGEYRAALFAYQDAVYAQPSHLYSRVKLGRAYLAMRYPSFAAAQAELVLASDPGSPDAKQLLEEARRTPGREIAGAAAAPAAAAAGAAAAAPPPRTYKMPEEPAGAAAPATAAPPAAGTAPAGGPAGGPAAGAAAGVAVAAAPPAPPPAAGPTAAQRYRAGVDLIGKRDYAGAVTELSEAIALDPRLAVAYAARASARFGLGRYREAADDYKASLGLDPGLATPLYGLAECYRLLGDPAAAEMYRRYADSKSPDVREDLRAQASKRAAELSGK
jgi:tetratricopeptide (TPR) repeat protein